MSVFNQRNRGSNIVRSSSVSSLCSLFNVALGFIYRTIFIAVLGPAYLGINGLFTSVLTALSLAELGITTAIVYRFYKPISMDDVQKVGELMVFFKWVYRAIALVIILAGVLVIPFFDVLVKDSSEIPSDVNLLVVYLLFLLQSSSTYLFSYRLSLLEADQRGYSFALIQTAISLFKYFAQAAVLLLSHDFTITLAVGVLSTLVLNVCFSAWVSTQYVAVFKVKKMLPKNERREIYSDVFATSCHKVGNVVLSATDNIVISSFVGIVSTGLYANYTLITAGVNTIVQKLFGSFTGSLGNANVMLSSEEKYALYKKLMFANFCVSGLVSSCLFLLVDDFISLWIGPDMLLGKLAVMAQCVYFFLSANRVINGSFTYGSGLFVKDKIRPFIEAAINIAASVFLVSRIGIAGVFFGTIISFLATVFWREPYLLHKYTFKQSIRWYWFVYFSVALFSVVFCGVASLFWSALSLEANWLVWLLKALVCVLFYPALYLVVFWKCDEAAFFRSKLASLLRGFRK